MVRRNGAFNAHCPAFKRSSTLASASRGSRRSGRANERRMEQAKDAQDRGRLREACRRGDTRRRGEGKLIPLKIAKVSRNNALTGRLSYRSVARHLGVSPLASHHPPGRAHRCTRVQRGPILVASTHNLSGGQKKPRLK